MAIEFEDKDNNLLASTIQRRFLSNGFIVASRPGFNVIRIDPPLSVSKKEIELRFAALTTGIGDQLAKRGMNRIK